MTFDAGSIEAHLTATRDDFNAALDQAKADADKFTSKPIKATIAADGTQAKTTLDDLTARADKLSGKDVTVKVKADGTDAKKTFDDATAQADKLNRKTATVHVRGEASQALSTFDKVAAKADELGRKAPTIKVQADATQANAEMDKTATKADVLGRKTETVTVRADTSGATKQIDTLSKKLTNLSNLLKDKSGPAWLGPAVLALPAATSLIGAASIAATGLGGAFAAAGVAAAGFAEVAKPVLTNAYTAATAVTTAQTAYTAAVAKTTGTYQAAMAVAKTRAQQTAAAAAEQKGFAKDRLAETVAQTKAYAGMSTQQIALSKQLGDIVTAWHAVQTAQTPVIAGALQPWLQTVTPLLHDLSALIAGVAPVIHDLGVKMDDVVSSAGFKGFVSFVTGTGSTALNSIGSTIIDLIDSFITLAPKFTPLIDQASAGIANFGANVLAWAQSKQASDDITGFLKWFSTNGPGAWTLIKNLGEALKALSPGLTSGGVLEMHILSDFLGWIAQLPPSFAKPLTEVIGALLLASKLGVLSLGVKVVGVSQKLLGLLTGSAKTSTISVASAGMTSAADTMLLASQNMLKAAGLEDTAGTGAGAGAKTGEGAAGGAAGFAGGLLSVAALAAVALIVLDNVKVPGGGSVLRPKQSDLGVGGTWWNDLGSLAGDKPQTGTSPGGAVAGGPSQLKALASASQQGEPDWTKWWQDFDRDVVQKIANWIVVTVPQTFTKSIPGWFTNVWNDFYRDAVTPVVNWITKSVPDAFTKSIPGWFTAVWADFNRDVVQKIVSWVTQSLPNFFTTTIPHWFDSVVAWFTSKVITPVKTFVTDTVPGFFTSTIPHWFDSVVTWLTSKVITPVKTFVTVTIPGFFTSTIPHWFDIAVTWLTSKVITPAKTFVMTTLPGFFTSTIPHWFDIAVTWLTSKVITPVKTFVMTTLPGFFTSTIPHWFDKFGAVLQSGIIAPITSFFKGLPSIIKAAFVTALNWVIGKINSVTAHIPLVGKDLSIPTISGAGGGVLPGYAPGQDTLYARLSPGEGILVPEAVQAVGPGWVTGMNAKYGHGRKSVGMAYAGGGIIPGVISGAISGVESIGSSILSEAGRMVSGALESGFNAIWAKSFQPIENTFAGDGMGGKLTAVAMAEFLAGVDTYLSSKDAATDASAGGGSGADVAAFAKSFATGQNHPYVTGGQGPNGWDCCLTYNTLVQTTEGPKQIGDIVPGDNVYTWNDGKLSINQVTWRSEPRVQQTYRLRTYHREVTASGNHPFLTLRKTGRCAPPEARFQVREKLVRPQNRRARQPVDAGEIRDMYLGGMSLSEVADAVGVSVGTVVSRLDETGTPRRPVGTKIGKPRHSRRDDWEFCWVQLDDLRRGDIVVMLKSLPDDALPPNDPYLSDERFLWLLGLAFGDGSMSADRRNRIYLCVFGDLRNEVQARLEDYCGKRAIENPKHGLYLHHADLAAGLHRFGMSRNGAPVKSTDRILPRELWNLPHHLIQAFLDGYTAADGSRSVGRCGDPFIRYMAANEQLIRGIQNLHMILGHGIGNVKEIKRTKPIVIRGREVKNARSLWSFEVRETGFRLDNLAGTLRNVPAIAELFPTDSRFAPQRITSIDAMEVEDTYDITVEGTHNFIADGLVVHNSGFSAYVYEHFGYFPGADKVRHGTSESQFADPLLQSSGPQTGALVFFDDGFYANPGHVGVMINASNYAGADSHAVGTVIAPASGAVGYRVPKGGFITSSPGKGNLIANASSIGSYLLGHGANKIAAAGIMGNMLQESGGNWNVGGGGLIQITGANPSSLAQSLAQTIAYINANGGMGPINASYNVPMATELFMNQYERPAAATENLARRLAGAAAAYAAGYDNGGWLQPGTTMVRNDTGRPEPVLNPAQWDSLSSAMAGGSDIGDKLDRIANLLAAQPRATASGVGDVLNNTGRMASFRNRYPRNN